MFPRERLRTETPTRALRHENSLTRAARGLGTFPVYHKAASSANHVPGPAKGTVHPVREGRGGGRPFPPTSGRRFQRPKLIRRKLIFMDTARKGGLPLYSGGALSLCRSQTCKRAGGTMISVPNEIRSSLRRAGGLLTAPMRDGPIIRVERVMFSVLFALAAVWAQAVERGFSPFKGKRS